ncbi:MAG TPA: hypothetical protein VGO52_16885 [Hyphomonadaceae bacterium]|nr:hypothetical protein [Hyphomonadaceae bacterium]
MPFFVSLILSALWHFGPVVALAFGLRSNRLLVFVPCAMLLAMYPLGYWLAHEINYDGIFGAEFSFGLLSVFFAPLVLVYSVQEAPGWVLLIVLAGLATGLLTWWFAQRRSGLVRTPVLAGMAVAFLVTWQATELGAELTLRARAAEQFGAYCNYRRASVFDMIAAGNSDLGGGTHATLNYRGDGYQYQWSFKQDRWLKYGSCDVVTCPCYDARPVLPNVSPRQAR